MTNLLTFTAMQGEVLGILTYRGLGDLSEIALISEADVFDQKKNPTGTQRDLNIRHARGAHEYVRDNDLAFWPEVVLCCRDSSVLDFELIDEDLSVGTLTVDFDKVRLIQEKGEIAISRLDGNHRLHFADGQEKGYDAIHRSASFCLLMGLGLDDEIRLFRDINNNQRRMNTSHLDTIVTRLTPEERLIRENPALHIAKKLGDDPDSPLHGRVFEGGRKSSGLHIPLRTLHTGITYLRQRSSKIDQLNDIEAEYLFIRNYWNALKKWVPGAWEEPKKYLLLRGAGLWGACMLGGIIIDRCLEKGKYTIQDMLGILNSGLLWDWSRNGDFRGLSGRGGAVEIANRISAEFSSESGVSIRRLAEKIKTG